MVKQTKKEFYSIAELAKILGISRIAVYKRIKRGRIKAEKIGRNYVISAESMNNILGHTLSEEEKKEIQKAVKKTVREYGEVLKRLGSN